MTMLFLTLFQFIVNVLNEPKDKALKTYSYRQNVNIIQLDKVNIMI